MNERNVLLDFLKGFTIVLVVLGHSIQSVQEQFDENVLFRIIYAFHMPLFMFLSGFVSFKTFDGSFKKLSKRFKSLIIPFWAWFLFSLLFSSCLFYLIGGNKPNFINSLINVLKSPDNGLWYLWVLFLNYLVLYFSFKINSKREEIIIFLFFIAINIFIVFTGINYLGLGLLSRHLLFFLLGYVTNKYLSNLKKVIKISGLISLILFPILVSFWHRTAPPDFSNYLTFNKVLIWGINFLYSLLVPVSGILAIYVGSGWLIQKEFPLKSSFIKLGNISLELYATQFYFFSLASIILFPTNLRIAMIFIIALFGSIFAQHLLKKIKYWPMIFYGKTPSGAT